MSTVFLIAGEESGDVLGGRLMAALKRRAQGTAPRFHGIGGAAMRAEGLESLIPMGDLAVMGLAEVLPRLPTLMRHIRHAADTILDVRPDVVVTIDAPDFCFRVAKRVKSRNPAIPIVHMVAPTVWAWRPGRAAKVAKFLDHMLCLLPFEPPYFEREGLAATFVGHPVVQDETPPGAAEAFRAAHAIAPDVPLLAVLPGSRTGEVTRHLPVFEEAVRRLADRLPGLRAVTVTVDATAGRVRDTVAAWPVPVTVVDGRAEGGAEKRRAFAAATAALAASGTVSVELALAGCPAVVAYRVNSLTAAIAKLLIRVKYASLVNIIADSAVIPEFIQENCRADRLADAVGALLADAEARAGQRRAFDAALTAMGRGGPPPAERAAAVVDGYL